LKQSVALTGSNTSGRLALSGTGRISHLISGKIRYRSDSKPKMVSGTSLLVTCYRWLSQTRTLANSLSYVLTPGSLSF